MIIMVETLILVIFSLITLIGLVIVVYLYFLERRKTKKIMKKLEKFDFKPIEKKINKLVEQENKYFKKIFELEMLLENYRKATWLIGEKVDDLEGKMKEVEKLPKDYERTYRNVVRKVLELDNKFTEKFKLLGEAILKLRDERKK
jgi:DNA repair ATPase RecN